MGRKGSHPLWDRFGITAAPAFMFVDKDGNEIDWIFGFVPPVEGLFLKITRSLKGIDTARSLSVKRSAEADNVEVLCKLGAKLMDRRLTAGQSRTLFRRVLELDPQGHSGEFSPDWIKGKVTYAEYSEYALGHLAALEPARDPKPLIAFLLKYPRSPLGELAQVDLIPFLSKTPTERP